MNQEPTIGRIVHYVLSLNKHRPAIITHVHNDSIVNLQVFADGLNDSKPYQVGLFWESSVEYDEVFKEEGTWHWHV